MKVAKIDGTYTVQQVPGFPAKEDYRIGSGITLSEIRPEPFPLCFDGDEMYLSVNPFEHASPGDWVLRHSGNKGVLSVADDSNFKRCFVPI